MSREDSRSLKLKKLYHFEMEIDVFMCISLVVFPRHMVCVSEVPCIYIDEWLCQAAIFTHSQVEDVRDVGPMYNF